jgi:hypothetical protein
MAATRRVVPPLLVVLILAGTSAAGLVYKVDDGTAEESLGLVQDSHFWWANAFTAGGTNEVEAIDVLFLSNSNLATSDPVRLLLYDDPDNDGNPDDAVLLQSVWTTVQSFGVFHRTSVTRTEVTGVFFVAALMNQYAENPQTGQVQQRPAARDTDSSQGASWVAASVGFDTLDPTDLTGSAETGVVNLEDIGRDSNLMLRAFAVPEPGTLGLLVVGGSALAAAALRRRRRRP